MTVNIIWGCSMWYIKIFFLIQFFVFTGGNFFSICLAFLGTYHKFIPKLFNRRKNLPFPGKENMSNFLKIQDTAYLKSMVRVWGYRILRHHFQQELWTSFLSFTFSLAAEKSNTGLILGLVWAYSFSLGTLVPFFFVPSVLKLFTGVSCVALFPLIMLDKW